MWWYKYRLSHRQCKLTATVHFPTRVQNQSSTAIANIFTDNYKFTKHTVPAIRNWLSVQDAQLLTIKDINLQTLIHHSYSIRNINKYSMEEFKIRLSYESWNSIFSDKDNTDVDSLFTIFLNNYSRIVYTSFPFRKIIERNKRRRWITTRMKTSCNCKRQLYLLSKDSNDINPIKYYNQCCKILARVITGAKSTKYTQLSIIRARINRFAA
jgi:hypothetical protein